MKCKPQLAFQLIILLLNSLFSLSGVAATQLQAQVEPVQINLGESCILTLELSEASTEDVESNQQPDLTPLSDQFIVQNQQRFQSYQSVNRQETRTVRWQYVLEPQKTGTLTIPALGLKTTVGTLYSQPLPITVNTGESQTRNDLRLETVISTHNPYLHQPIYYTLRLYHRGDIREIEPSPPTEGVITEQLTKLTHRRVTVEGEEKIVSEITYLLTPLQSGLLELTPGKMKVLKPDNRRGADNSGGFNFFTNYLPTNVSSTKETLTVQPPPTAQVPWLPLKNLQFEQKWESDLTQAVTVGTPLVRTLHLTAEGMGAQPLPDLNLFLPESPELRIRSPKPETERTLLADGKTPASIVTQTFSLIPLKSGTLQLPAIRIPWWNIEQNKLAWAELPAQTITVIDNQQATLSSQPTVTVGQASSPQFVYFTGVQYVLFTIALIALFIAFGTLQYNRIIQRKPLVNTSVHHSRLSHSTFKQQLQATDDLNAISKLLKIYAHHRWNTSLSASLLTLADYIKVHCIAGINAADVLKELDAALYGKQPLEINAWKQRCQQAFDSLREQPLAKPSIKAVLEPLNPI